MSRGTLVSDAHAPLTGVPERLGELTSRTGIPVGVVAELLGAASEGAAAN
ncbi:hypothetical protein [Streptomyces sasae]|nr:hypothetical protein [Streptomyces sasae]